MTCSACFQKTFLIVQFTSDPTMIRTSQGGRYRLYEMPSGQWLTTHFRFSSFPESGVTDARHVRGLKIVVPFETRPLGGSIRLYAAPG